MDVQGEWISVPEHNSCRMRASESNLEPFTPAEGPLKCVRAARTILFLNRCCTPSAPLILSCCLSIICGM
jgi:hypothetical protein